MFQLDAQIDNCVYAGDTDIMDHALITGEIDIISDYGVNHETLDARGPYFDSSHFGADVELVHAIRDHYFGLEPAVNTKDGFESLRMVLATEESIRRNGARISLT